MTYLIHHSSGALVCKITIEEELYSESESVALVVVNGAINALDKDCRSGYHTASPVGGRKLTVSVLDVCYPDYFQGTSKPHLAVPVSSSMDVRDFCDATLCTANAEDFPFSQDELSAALNSYFEFYPISRKLFTSIGEDCYAYVAVEE